MSTAQYELFYGSAIPQRHQYPYSVVTVASRIPLFTFSGDNTNFYCYPTEPTNINDIPSDPAFVMCTGPPVGRFNPEDGVIWDVFRAPADLGPLPRGTVIIVGGLQEVSRTSRRNAFSRTANPRISRSSTHRHPTSTPRETTPNRSLRVSVSIDLPPPQGDTPHAQDFLSRSSTTPSRRRHLVSGHAGDGGNAEGSREDGICPICLEELALGEAVKRCPECRNPFHSHCLGYEREIMEGYLRCPTCRVRLSGAGLE